MASNEIRSQLNSKKDGKRNYIFIRAIQKSKRRQIKPNKILLKPLSDIEKSNPETAILLSLLDKQGANYSWKPAHVLPWFSS